MKWYGVALCDVISIFMVSYASIDKNCISRILTLSNTGFLGFSQPEEGHKVFAIGRIMMKLGKLVRCYMFYLLMGFLVRLAVIMTS